MRICKLPLAARTTLIKSTCQNIVMIRLWGMAFSGRTSFYLPSTFKNGENAAGAATGMLFDGENDGLPLTNKLILYIRRVKRRAGI